MLHHLTIQLRTSIHGKDFHIKNLISTTVNFMKNLCWRAFFFLNPDTNTTEKETHSFNSTKPAPIIPELKKFENNLARLVQNIQFKHTENKCQQQLRKGLNLIKKDKHLYILAGKTSNYYRIKQLVNKSIQKEY